MPTVPQYNQQVEERPLTQARSGVNAPLSAFGGGATLDRAFQSGTNLLGDIAGFADEERRRADRAREKQNRVAINDFELRNIYDYETGAARTVGEEAFGVVEKLQGEYQKFIEEHKKTLANERQKQAFSEMATERWNGIARWANDHVARQRDVVEQSAFQAERESSKDRAAADPRNLQVELENVRQSVVEQYGGKLSPTAVSEELKKQETDLHMRVIDAHLLEGRTDAATSHFKEYAGRIDETKKAGIEDKIKRREAEQEKERLETLSTTALNVIEKTKDFNALPNNVVEALPLNTRSALRRYAESLQAGGRTKSDPETFYALTNMSDDEFKETDLMGYVDKLTTSDWQRFALAQKELRGGKRAKLLDGFRTKKNIVDLSLRSIGINPNDKSKKQAGRVARFYEAVDERIMELQEQTGKKATNEDVQKIADDLLLRGSIEGTGFFGTGFGRDKKFLFEVDPGESIVGDIRDVPQEERAKIVDALQRKGRDVTEEEIARLYNLKLRGAIDANK